MNAAERDDVRERAKPISYDAPTFLSVCAVSRAPRDLCVRRLLGTDGGIAMKKAILLCSLLTVALLEITSAVEMTSHSSPSSQDLTGDWVCNSNCSGCPLTFGKPGEIVRIVQDASRLRFTNVTNEAIGSTEGLFVDANTITASQWAGGLKAIIENGGDTIHWANGCIWVRRRPRPDSRVTFGPRGKIKYPKGRVELYAAAFNKWKGPITGEFPVYAGDRVRTGPESSAVVFISTASGAEDRIDVMADSIVEVPALSTESGANSIGQHPYLELGEGTIRCTTNRPPPPGNQEPSPFNVRTPTVSLGTRGTEFILRHDSSRKMDFVFLRQGRLEVRAENETKELKAGEQLYSQGGRLSPVSRLDARVWDSAIAGRSVPGVEAFANAVSTEGQANGGQGVSAVGMEFKTDRPGSDYKNFDLPRASPELCRDACASDPNCRAFTYVRPRIQGPNARCWLKSGVPTAASSDCCVSGVKKARN